VVSSIADDERHMRHALRLAERSLGRVAPNPAVGCVIISKNGVVAGRGWTGAGGRPHAENLALQQAGERAKGSTAYVTLEPCAHHGVTPPCANSLIAAGIARVVGAIVDPDPRVCGKGFAKLAEAGVDVTQGVCEQEAREVNKGFFLRVEGGRPLVALKSAESADGFVAGQNAADRWITSEEARRHGHLLRAKHDAIMVGIETAIADDPLLTCRLEGLEDRTPLRIVLDSHLRLSASSQLARSVSHGPVLVFTASKTPNDALAAAGVEVVAVGVDKDNHPDVGDVLKDLARRGITRLLVEGGPKMHLAFLVRDVVDVIYRYRAPKNLGAGLPSVLDPFLPPSGKGGLNMTLVETAQVGPDLLERFEARG
jgi:diaminohydroxyphosphoribosylaminopyrimidine deaminase/5-amino-6-(5-phosphoribosylamino)uracil reductase